MKLHSVILQVTTDGAGAGQADDEAKIFGRLYAVEWIVGTFSAGVDAVLSIQSTLSGVAKTLLTLTDANANALYYPRHLVHSEAGAALTGTSGGDRVMPIIDGKLRLAVTSGGATKAGSVVVWYTRE